MNIAVAQLRPEDRDIDQNLKAHYKLVEAAARYGAGLIAFPEMSVTGYVREAAKELSFTENDPRLNKLRKLACKFKIIIIAGAPVKLDSGLYIGSFIIFPDNTVSIYTKQFLHSGEEEYFSSSFGYNPVIELEGERIGLAICADINNPEHAWNASRAQCSIYLAGIFFSKPAMAEAHSLLSGYAEKHSMAIVMSNFCGKSWGLAAGGRSAVWSEEGKLIAEMDTFAAGMLLARKINGKWTAEVVAE